MQKKHNIGKIAIIITILLLVFVMLFSGLQILESTIFNKDDENDTSRTYKTITRDGVEYFPRQDIDVFLLMGIDQYGPVESSNSYNNMGEADMVLLAIFDKEAENYSILALNRDTMMDIPLLGVGGKPAGTAYGQLALAHTYGSGLEDSCENTRKAVSDFLYGISIDHYVSMNMDAIGILNDAVGGVRVVVTEDFSRVNSTIPVGEVVLNADQALSYVQTRKDVGDQLNLSRMERQEAYMKGFIEALNMKFNENESFIIDTYDSVSEYVVTDCSVNTISSLIDRFSDYSFKEIISPEGENVMGETYMEFYVDEKPLDDLILRLFYEEKN